jgi:hypothetical protein
MEEKNASNAANPPADAPIPTIGNRAALGVVSVSAASTLLGSSGFSDSGSNGVIDTYRPPALSVLLASAG